MISAASLSGDAQYHKGVVPATAKPFCLGRRCGASSVVLGVPAPWPKGEVIATEFVVRGRREGGAPDTRCSMSERASTGFHRLPSACATAPKTGAMGAMSGWFNPSSYSDALFPPDSGAAARLRLRLLAPASPSPSRSPRPSTSPPAADISTCSTESERWLEQGGRRPR